VFIHHGARNKTPEKSTPAASVSFLSAFLTACIFLNHPHHDLHVLPADVHFDDAKLGPGQCCFSTITDLWRSILASLSKAKLEIQ